MTGIGLVQIGSAGLQAGIEQAQQAANEITRIGTQAGRGLSDNADLAESTVDLMEAKLQTQASANVLKTADQLIGSLIDTTI